MFWQRLIENHFIDYFILFIYAIGMVAVAVYTRGRSKSVSDFLLAGKRGLNGWMSAFAYGTTYFSSVIFIGYAGKFGQQYGLASIWIGVGNAIIGALIAWMVLAKRTKNMTARLSAKTMPDFFEKRYGSKGLKVTAAVVIFIFLIPYSASVYSGLSALFETVFDIPGWAVMICLALLTAIYLFFGGYFATALSDFIQGIIMVVGILLTVWCFMRNGAVNWDISEIINDPELTLFTFGSTKTGLYGNTVSLISLILLTSFGVWALPQTIHKYYAIRDKRAIKQGTVVSTVFAFIIGFCAYFIGSLSKLFSGEGSVLGAGDKLIVGDLVIPTMLAAVVPTGLIGIVAVLILSASMSTLSSVSLASASVVAVDIYKGTVNKKASDKHTNTVMRILCLVFILISVLLAIANEKLGITAIAYMMGLSWGTLAGCFMGPFVLGILWRKTTRAGVWASIIGSLSLTAILILLFGYDQNGFDCTFGTALKSGVGCSPMIGVICMIYSVISTFTVSCFTKCPTKKMIHRAFDQPIENEIK